MAWDAVRGELTKLKTTCRGLSAVRLWAAGISATPFFSESYRAPGSGVSAGRKAFSLLCLLPSAMFAGIRIVPDTA
jgi:hypothetical protein